MIQQKATLQKEKVNNDMQLICVVVFSHKPWVLN